MLKLFDVFYDESGKEFYGILDTDTNMLDYVTYFDLQKKCSSSAIDIAGIKYTNLNSVGLKITNDVESKLKHTNNKFVKEYAIKPYLNYETIDEFSIRKIPVGYRILKDNIIYTFQHSARMGACWRAHIFCPVIDELPYVCLEKTLLGFDVLDVSNFFEENTYKGASISQKDKYKAFCQKQYQKYMLDFTEFDFSGIQNIENFLTGYPFDIALPRFDLTDVHYCNSAFVTDLTSTEGFQIIDISQCETSPFILDDTDFIQRKRLVQLFLICDNSWLINKLQEVEAVRLHDYTEVEQPVLKVKQMQGKYALMNKVFEKQVYYAVRQ